MAFGASLWGSGGRNAGGGSRQDASQTLQGSQFTMPHLYGITYKPEADKAEEAKRQFNATMDFQNRTFAADQAKWAADNARKQQGFNLVTGMIGAPGGAPGGAGGAGGVVPGTGGPGPIPIAGGGAGVGGYGAGTPGGYEERLYPQPFQTQWGQAQLNRAPQIAAAYGPQQNTPAAGHQRMLAALLSTQQANNQRVNDLRQMGQENLGYAGTQRTIQQQDMENQRTAYQNQLDNRNQLLSLILGR